MNTVFVQESPRLANTYASDGLLKSYLEWKLGPDLLASMEEELLELGELTTGKLFELQRADRCNEPTLTQWDAWGSSIARCRTSPAVIPHTSGPVVSG